MNYCYLCGQLIDGATNSRDHVIPRTLRGKEPPKVKGIDYGGVLPTHSECNNRFGDEKHVNKALQLLGALNDSNTTLVRPARGSRNGRVLVLNGKKLTGFGSRDLRFFGIHDARNDSVASFNDFEYYADKPRINFKKTVLCTIVSVLAKSAAALLVSRHLSEPPTKWHIVCVPYAGDMTRTELSPFFKENRHFAKEIRVWTNRLETSSWVSVYATSSATVLLFFLMDDDCNLVTKIPERFPLEECIEFRGKSLMDLVGHDWPSIRHA